MKVIPLKVFQESINGKEMFFSYYTLIENAINQQPQGGIKVDEMSKRLRILKALETSKDIFEVSEEMFQKNPQEVLSRVGSFELEDSDLTKLKELIKETKWGIVSYGVLRFCEHIEAIK